MAVLSQGRAGGWLPWCGALLHSQPPFALWHQFHGIWRHRFLGAVLCNLQIIESAQKRLPKAPGLGLAGIGSDEPSGLKMSASALADLPSSAGNCHFLLQGRVGSTFCKTFKLLFTITCTWSLAVLAQWEALGQWEGFQCL